jgi:mono/diheme cytochrome c family protein
VFVGRSDGRVTALDKDNGDLLWEFMTDAGVNSTITTFERRAKQYVVVHAGGGVFANGKRGDGIWMFSLDGTLEPFTPQAAPSVQAAARAAAAAAQPPLVATGPADLDNGARLYREACVPCHGVNGAGGEGGGAALTRGLTRDSVLAVVAAGRNSMPAFRASYGDQELRDVAAYVAERLVPVND